jgi:hypothetical protein
VPARFPSLLPMDPTRVRRDARGAHLSCRTSSPAARGGRGRPQRGGPLAVEHLHLPHKAAGVDKTPLERALAMAVTFILCASLKVSN